MNKDDFLDEHLDKFLSIEVCILAFYRSHPTLVDHNVDKVYEAFQRHYEKLLQGKEAPALRLKGDEETLYKELCEVIYELFGILEDAEDQKSLVATMKRLRKSIHTWTGSAYGRQGYLNYIDRMMP